jgi:surfeit locus 1 family protein
MRKAGLIWPTLAMLAGVGVLIALGSWQMERKRWKEALIAKVAERVHAEPVSLESYLDEARASVHQLPASSGLTASVLAIGDLEYLHVTARGRFHHDKERYLYAPAPGGLGWHVYAPLELPSQQMVWVNRGFVPDERKAPDTRPRGQVAGEVEVRGLVRLPAGQGAFTPRNDPVHNIWYWPDLPAMTASAFPGGPPAGGVLPLAIDADARPEPPGGFPRGGVTRLELPNRHLEYALTWYGLAAALVGVYLTFAFSRLRAAS